MHIVTTRFQHAQKYGSRVMQNQTNNWSARHVDTQATSIAWRRGFFISTLVSALFWVQLKPKPSETSYNLVHFSSSECNGTTVEQKADHAHYAVLDGANQRGLRVRAVNRNTVCSRFLGVVELLTHSCNKDRFWISYLFDDTHNSVAPGAIRFNKGTITNGGKNRSPLDYDTNPDDEKKRYEFNHDTDLRLLQFRDAKDNLRGVLSFYPVHPTSLTLQSKPKPDRQRQWHVPRWGQDGHRER
ncbi:Neutral ceramidase, partial [Globisporangium splendens]